MITVLGGCQNKKVKFGKWKLFLLKEEDKVVGFYIKMPKEYQLKRITDSTEEKVKKVNFNSENIIIKEATFSLPQENNSLDISLGNFMISKYGEYSLKEDFFSEKFTFDYQGIEYNIPGNALDFLEGNIIVKKGEASFRNSREKLAINNLYLLNQNLWKRWF